MFISSSTQIAKIGVPEKELAQAGNSPQDSNGESTWYDLQKQIEELRTAQLANFSTELDIKNRHTMAGKIFNLTCACIFTVLGIIVADGAHLIHLSDSILEFLLTSTIVEVISVFNFVAKYLYKQNK